MPKPPRVKVVKKRKVIRQDSPLEVSYRKWRADLWKMGASRTPKLLRAIDSGLRAEKIIALPSGRNEFIYRKIPDHQVRMSAARLLWDIASKGPFTPEEQKRRSDPANEKNWSAQEVGEAMAGFATVAYTLTHGDDVDGRPDDPEDLTHTDEE